MPTAGGRVTGVPERTALVAFLDAQREHVLKALDGLSDQALRRPVLPSGWTCLGLVQHLALDVERFWFRAVVAGEQVEYESGDVLHVLTETACHAGHLDAARELIDSRQQLLLT